MARISTQLGEIRAGRGAALALQGEPGIGKTALLDWAAGQAGDMRMLRATGIESELELAFSGLAELCMPLLGRLDEIPAPQRDALRAAFALADGRPGDRFVLAMATASLLQAEARERPVLALIDDAQWLDRASADALDVHAQAAARRVDRHARRRAHGRVRPARRRDDRAGRPSGGERAARCSETEVTWRPRLPGGSSR